MAAKRKNSKAKSAESPVKKRKTVSRKGKKAIGNEQDNINKKAIIESNVEDTLVIDIKTKNMNNNEISKTTQFNELKEKSSDTDNIKTNNENKESTQNDNIIIKLKRTRKNKRKNSNTSTEPNKKIDVKQSSNLTSSPLSNTNLLNNEANVENPSNKQNIDNINGINHIPNTTFNTHNDSNSDNQFERIPVAKLKLKLPSKSKKTTQKTLPDVNNDNMDMDESIVNGIDNTVEQTNQNITNDINNYNNNNNDININNINNNCNNDISNNNGNNDNNKNNINTNNNNDHSDDNNNTLPTNPLTDSNHVDENIKNNNDVNTIENSNPNPSNNSNESNENIINHQIGEVPNNKDTIRDNTNNNEVDPQFSKENPKEIENPEGNKVENEQDPNLLKNELKMEEDHFNGQDSEIEKNESKNGKEYTNDHDQAIEESKDKSYNNEKISDQGNDNMIIGFNEKPINKMDSILSKEADGKGHGDGEDDNEQEIIDPTSISDTSDDIIIDSEDIHLNNNDSQDVVQITDSSNEPNPSENHGSRNDINYVSDTSNSVNLHNGNHEHVEIIIDDNYPSNSNNLSANSPPNQNSQNPQDYINVDNLPNDHYNGASSSNSVYPYPNPNGNENNIIDLTDDDVVCLTENVPPQRNNHHPPRRPNLVLHFGGHSSSSGIININHRPNEMMEDSSRNDATTTIIDDNNNDHNTVNITIDLTDDTNTNTIANSNHPLPRPRRNPRSFNYMVNNSRRNIYPIPRPAYTQGVFYAPDYRSNFNRNLTDIPIQLTQSIPPHHLFNIVHRIPAGHLYASDADSNENLPEEFNRPSTLAGRAVEEARESESHSNIQFQNLKCSICLSNPTTDTRLDCTICGHVFCHDCLQRALRENKRCPTCRKPLRNRYSVHPLYTN